MTHSGKKKSSKKRKSSGNSGNTPDDKKINRRLESDFEDMASDGNMEDKLEKVEQNESRIEQCLNAVHKQLDGKIIGIIESVDFLSSAIEDLKNELKSVKDELRKN